MNFSIYYYVAWMTAKLDNYCWKNYGGRRGGGAWYLFFLHEWNITSLLFSGAMYFTEWSRGVKFGVESWSTFLEWGYQKKKYEYICAPVFSHLETALHLKGEGGVKEVALVLFPQTKFIFMQKHSNCEFRFTPWGG